MGLFCMFIRSFVLSKSDGARMNEHNNSQEHSMFTSIQSNPTQPRREQENLIISIVNI